MSRKLIYPTLLLLVLGATVGQAQDSTWIRAAWWDGRYPTNWADEASTIAVRDGLVAAGYELLDSDQLKTWMNARIADKKLSVVVFCRDIAPDTVIESMSATCTLRKYLDAGGKIVFYADIPFYNQGHADGTMTNWAEAGANAILGIGNVSVWDTNTQTTITPLGIRWGLTQTWASVRPYATSGLDVLATDGQGNAAAWVKHYVAGDSYRGFVRLWDRGGYPPVADIIRVAEYVGLKAGSPDPADGAVGVVMPLLTWQPGGFAVFHNVYFGTTPDLTEADLVSSRQLFTMYYHIPGLQPGTTYYWRIDEIEANGTIRTGDLWHFMSEPVKAYAPAPADGATGMLPGLNLTWLKGKGATGQQVFFGTDQAAVAAGDASVDKGTSTDATFNTGALRASTTYYWRVDTVKTDGTEPGDVWSFTTVDAGPADKIEAQVWLNIGSGTTVTDLTNSPRYPGSPDTTEYLDSWLFPPGSTGGSDWANNYGDRLFGWLKPEQTGDYTFWIAGDDLSELWLSTDGSPTNATIIARVTGWTDAMDWDGTTGSTNVAALKSAPQHLEAGQKYFIMTLHKEGGGGDSVGVAWQGPGIAARTLLSAKYVDMFYLAPLQAFSPSPANGAVDTVQSLDLSWSAGEKAQKHEVYFGDDKDAVAAADNTSPLFQGSQAGTTYSTGELEWGKTYYWRVDEINAGEADSPWKGAVWSFTTADFIPIDNFESYNDDMEAMTTIFDTWIDGVTNGLSGSTVGNFQAPFAERTIVHGGAQAMPMDYDNTNSPFFSEAERDFSPVQDWTVNGVTDLTLYFRGASTNGAGALYVAVGDSANKVAVVTNPDPAAVTVTTWTEWKIPLSSFTGVNLAKVKALYIGVGDRNAPVQGGAGRIYIDDIRVTKP
jgi:hypothetical protein